jgi:hypothetical protein
MGAACAYHFAGNVQQGKLDGNTSEQDRAFCENTQADWIAGARLPKLGFTGTPQQPQSLQRNISPPPAAQSGTPTIGTTTALAFNASAPSDNGEGGGALQLLFAALAAWIAAAMQ